jgi:tetratricopeptide (TPR) repeat protein
LSLIQGELDFCHKNIKRSNKLIKQVDHKRALCIVYLYKAALFYYKGDLNRAIENQNEALNLARKLIFKKGMIDSLKNLGIVYQEQGNFILAKKNLEEALEISENYNNTRSYLIYHALFQLFIKKGDLSQAKCYLDQLKEKKNISPIASLAYRLNKAILLKTSPRVINRGKAEKILKKIVKEDFDFEAVIIALVNLCDLLIIELRETSNLEILEELKLFIAHMQDIAKKSHSFIVLAESFLLQARLALVALELKNARLLLAQAQKIADNYGLKWLAIKISNEHDELLKQIESWEKMEEIEAPISERIELSRLNEQMQNMVQKRIISQPKLSEETPVLLLIVSEGGNPVFSQSFVEDQKFEDHLFGGFFSAINSFISEKFSEGLNRATFGEYTLLLNYISPFLMCYIFKGQSYSAQTRINYFINKIQKDEPIWQTFERFYKLNKEVQLIDVPSLEPLISDTFIKKNIPLNIYS